MPFRQALSDLYGKAEQRLNNQHSSQPQAPSYSRPVPPPVPTGSKPPPVYPSHAAPQHHSHPYWQPRFDASAPVSANFKHEEGQHGWGNNESQNYTSSPQNSFHASDGSDTLVLHAVAQTSHPDHGQKYTSARLSSHQTLARPRGCLSARITAPVARGIWPAFWLLPHDPFVWPTDGEVDIMEAWDGDAVNHSCLHWGHFNGQDWDKHRVVESPIRGITSAQGVRFDFAWDEDEATGQGKLVWYIDGRVVMKADKPRGTRPMRDYRILINVAMGGNVCQGHLPSNGVFEMRVRELAMWDAPPGGWGAFENDWRSGKEGKTM
ncbi:hypothetical protein MBLNU459_g7634t1 [Dothideomycetes sp. NU459]